MPSPKDPNEAKIEFDETSPSSAFKLDLSKLTTPPQLYYLIVILIPLFAFMTLYGLILYYRANPNLTPPAALQTFVEDEAAVDQRPTPAPTPRIPEDVEVEPSPSPTPIPLTPGPGVYNVSQAAHTGPTVSRVTFDPLDVDKGENLTLTLDFRPDSPPTSVTATLEMDNSTQALTFEHSGTSDKYDTWTTQFTLDDSVLYQYILTITATNSEGTSTATVAPRS